MLPWMDSLRWWRRLSELGRTPPLTHIERDIVDRLTSSTIIRRRLPARLVTVENGDNVVKVRMSAIHRLHDLGLLRVVVSNIHEEVWRQITPSEQLVELSERYFRAVAYTRTRCANDDR